MFTKINYSELYFDHAVVFSNEDTVFATARENGSGRTRIFLIFSREKDHVYTRNGVADSWELLADDEARDVLNRIYCAINTGLTIYKFNGGSQAITGHHIPVN